MVQALRAGDRAKRMEFCKAILRDMEDGNFSPRLIFSNEATFYISGKVNCHIVRISGLKNPQEILEHHHDSPKLNVFCAVSLRKVYEPFFFEENTICRQTYLEMLQQWIFPQINKNFENFIFHQDGASQHWHRLKFSEPNFTSTLDRTGQDPKT